jgi:hypothetical protein
MMKEEQGTTALSGFINAVYCGKEPANGWKKLKSSPDRMIRVDWQISQLQETWEWARGLMEAEKLYESLGIWPQDEKACGNYGGCEFLSLCQRPQVLWESHARSNFREWRNTGVLRSGADGNEEVRG